MKKTKLVDLLLEEEETIMPPADLEEKVQKKISDFTLIYDLFKHFTDIPLYLIDTKEIEGEENE